MQQSAGIDNHITPLRIVAVLGVNLLYSAASVLSKYAATSVVFSERFFLFFGLMALAMFLYAIVWQQLIKRIPLSVAYPFKGVVVIYNLIWAALLFNEVITPLNIAGAVLILFGVFMVGQND